MLILIWSSEVFRCSSISRTVSESVSDCFSFKSLFPVSVSPVSPVSLAGVPRVSALLVFETVLKISEDTD